MKRQLRVTWELIFNKRFRDYRGKRAIMGAQYSLLPAWLSPRPAARLRRRRRPDQGIGYSKSHAKFKLEPYPVRPDGQSDLLVSCCTTHTHFRATCATRGRECARATRRTGRLSFVRLPSSRPLVWFQSAISAGQVESECLFAPLASGDAGRHQRVVDQRAAN